jgi:hypothetical protein
MSWLTHQFPQQIYGFSDNNLIKKHMESWVNPLQIILFTNGEDKENTKWKRTGRS